VTRRGKVGVKAAVRDAVRVAVWMVGEAAGWMAMRAVRAVRVAVWMAVRAVGWMAVRLKGKKIKKGVVMRRRRTRRTRRTKKKYRRRRLRVDTDEPVEESSAQPPAKKIKMGNTGKAQPKVKKKASNACASNLGLHRCACPEYKSKARV
jgi:hypothetical protein